LFLFSGRFKPLDRFPVYVVERFSPLVKFIFRTVVFSKPPIEKLGRRQMRQCVVKVKAGAGW
jgi:hypothetical protein